MDSKSPKPPPPVKSTTTTPKSLVKSSLSSSHSSFQKPQSTTTLTTKSTSSSGSRPAAGQNGRISLLNSVTAGSSSSSIGSTSSNNSSHSGTSQQQRKSTRPEATKTSTTTSSANSSSTPKSNRKPPIVSNSGNNSSQQTNGLSSTMKTNSKVVSTTTTPVSSSKVIQSARSNVSNMSARSNVSAQSPITPSRQINRPPSFANKAKDIVPPSRSSGSLVISKVPSSSKNDPSSSRSTSSSSSTSSQFNSLLISNTYDDSDDDYDDFILPEPATSTSSSSSSTSIAKKFNLTLNLSSITNTTPPSSTMAKVVAKQTKPPTKVISQAEPILAVKKKETEPVTPPVKTPTTTCPPSASPQSSSSTTRKSNILHGGISSNSSTTTLPRSKKTTPRISNIMLEQPEEHITSTHSVNNSVDILSARPVVDDVIFNKSPSQSSTSSSSPKPATTTSSSHSEDSLISTSTRSKQSSLYDEHEEYKNFEDKEIATLQQSFSKSSRTTLQAENSEQFWNLVEKSHTCILYESEKMYKLFCLWMREGQEEEINELYPEDEKSRRDELGKLKANTYVIYEDAFCQIVQYFLQLACKYSDELLDHWCEYNCLDVFDFLDVKSCGAVSKESVFMILCLISSQICRKLNAFLETFGDTLFEFCRPIVSKSSVSKTVNIHMTRRLALICNIDDVHFTKVVCKLGLVHCENLKREEVFKIYSSIFSRYDKGSLTEKGYFVPPMVTPLEEKHTAPISARTFGNIYQETPNSSSTLTNTSVLLETKSNATEETTKETQVSARTPKVVYSSSTKISLPLRNNSNTQLVDTLSNDHIVKPKVKGSLTSQQESIEEKHSARREAQQSDTILEQHPKDQKLNVSANNNVKGNKYLIETITPTPNNEEPKKKKRKKKWKCCVM